MRTFVLAVRAVAEFREWTDAGVLFAFIGLHFRLCVRRRMFILAPQALLHLYPVQLPKHPQCC